jgi:murein DD-endopeptidase
VNTRTAVAIAAWALGLSAAVLAQSRSPIASALDIQVGAAPALVRVASREHLVHELHVTNFMRSDVTVTRVEVRDAVRGTVLVDLRDAALASHMARPGLPSDLPDNRVIGPGLRAIVYFWLPLDPDAPAPARVRHVVDVDVTRAEQRVSLSADAAEAAVRQDRPVVLTPPLRGGPWVALYDPMLVGGHRTAIYAVDGRARIPARFAIDFVRLENDGSHARGDRTAIANWHGYGAEVLAVADAAVIEARDDIPEARSLAAAVTPVPLENVSGNYVSLDLGGGRYAFYEHLKHGSVRVKPGDRVKAGDVLGLVGNSGSSSSGPHLHFHVADAPAELAAEGIPFAFAAFDSIGVFDSVGAFTTGERWKSLPPDAGGRRQREMPAPNSAVVFPGR